MPELKSQPDSQPAKIDAGAPDPLAGLYHMSNTAGVSTQDYVAINPTAIAALLLGFASVSIILSDILLVVPLIAVVCAIVAITQIRNSNGTQTGRLLAFTGLILAVLVGGGRAAYVSVGAFRVSASERQIAQVVHTLGDDLMAERYEQAYARFTDEFHQRVPFPTFQKAFKGLNDERIGALKSVEWNGQKMVFEEKPDSPVTYAVAMTVFYYEKASEPRRLLINFEGTGGAWRMSDMQDLFPHPKK